MLCWTAFTETVLVNLGFCIEITSVIQLEDINTNSFFLIAFTTATTTTTIIIASFTTIIIATTTIIIAAFIVVTKPNIIATTINRVFAKRIMELYFHSYFF